MEKVSLLTVNVKKEQLLMEYNATINIFWDVFAYFHY